MILRQENKILNGEVCFSDQRLKLCSSVFIAETICYKFVPFKTNRQLSNFGTFTAMYSVIKTTYFDRKAGFATSQCGCSHSTF
jgi:hypothetical protein